jgi:hypothetical protein
MNMGDGREIFVRYHLDHSRFVNDHSVLTENDLRHEIRAAMSTRAEQVVFFGFNIWARNIHPSDSRARKTPKQER